VAVIAGGEVSKRRPSSPTARNAPGCRQKAIEKSCLNRTPYPDGGQAEGERAGILTDVKEIEEDSEAYLDWWNLLEQADIGEFKNKIRVLREHIERTIGTPIAERGEPALKL